MSEYNVNMLPRVVDGLVDIRNRLEALKAEYDAKTKSLKEAEERGENWLLGCMQHLGLDQLKVPSGTAYLQTKQRSGIGDWNAFSQWSAATGNVDLLQHRLNEQNLKRFLEENGGQLPPGVSTSPVRTVVIKRASVNNKE